MGIAVLLKQVHEITKRYKEIEQITGENFNIFKTLGLQRNESCHSRVIKMLLDPKGDHEQGDLFLKLFFERMLPARFSSVNLQSAKVEIEYSMEFGRPDIFIHNDDFGVIIENKIDAEDQDRQIERYAKFLFKRFGENNNIHLIYLTPDGRDPGESSIGDFQNKNDLLVCRSYMTHIIEWLELCHKESHKMPLLRETIAQYINIIKDLTGQTRSRQMKEEFIDLLKSPENIQAVFEISRLRMDLIKNLMENNLLKPLQESVKRELGLELIPPNAASPTIYNKRYGFSFKNPDWSTIEIRFEFYGPAQYFQNFFYGIWGENSELSERLKDKNAKPWEKYIHWENIDGYNDWINEGVFPKLSAADNEVVKTIKDKISKMLDLLDNYAQGIKL